MDIALTERLGSNGFSDKFGLSALRQTKHDSNAVYYFPDPGRAVFLAFSLPPSVDPTYINIYITSKQDALKQPKANFSALSYYKSSVETNFPIFAIAFLH